MFLALIAAAVFAGPVHASPRPAPTGFCPGTSSTYPWAAGTIWYGKVFDGKGRLINRTVAGEIVGGTVRSVGPRRWRIDYKGLPVTDYITARGRGYYTGDIFVAGQYAGAFELRCPYRKKRAHTAESTKAPSAESPKTPSAESPTAPSSATDR